MQFQITVLRELADPATIRLWKRPRDQRYYQRDQSG